MKRFYEEVNIAPSAGGFQILLDGRAIKTQARAAQILPSEVLAQKMAEEWRAQGDEMDAAGFVLRDFADYAIDQISPDPAAILPKLLSFAQTDTLCYFAEPDEALFERQQKIWEPLLAGFEAQHSIRMKRISGIVHSAQSEPTMARLGDILRRQTTFTLAAIQTTSSIAASLVIGLESIAEGADAKALFDAANLEEDWQAELWGEDELAAEVRANNAKAFAAAAEFSKLASS